MTTEAEVTKVYILDLKGGGQRRVTVPASWKVTFGPLLVGARGSGEGCLALRFYEGKELQRAIFTDVKSFRDESIPMEERVTKTKTQTVRRETPEGAKDFVIEARVKEWRDPDATHQPDDDFLALPPMEDLADEFPD